MGRKKVKVRGMEKYQLKSDITVFGFEVKTSPIGIGEAFDKLVNNIPGGFSRDYYGISFLNSENKMVYLATALEKEHGEAENINAIGTPLKKVITWLKQYGIGRKKTDLIKDVFKGLFNSYSRDLQRGPCIEWYKDNNEMLCMVKLAQTQ
jgi:hypothetical protein